MYAFLYAKMYALLYGAFSDSTLNKKLFFSLEAPSEWILVFDTETTIDESQKLRFGTYQVRKGKSLRSGPTSSDKLAAKLSYIWLVDVMPLVSHIQGHAPEYEKQYKLHLVSVH